MSATPPSGSAKRLLPWLVAVAFFMESLDTTILNTAVPTIAEALGVVPLNMKAALTSYTLSLAVFIPVSGWVADRMGARTIFGTAIVVFGHVRGKIGRGLMGASAPRDEQAVGPTIEHPVDQNGLGPAQATGIIVP